VTPNGTAIRAIREAQRVSIRRLALHTGLNRGYLSRLERSHIRETADDKVRAIAAVLDVPIDAITHKETP
jgi:transcriptional regulator with XRE-family HTH domain